MSLWQKVDQQFENVMDQVANGARRLAQVEEPVPISNKTHEKKSQPIDEVAHWLEMIKNPDPDGFGIVNAAKLYLSKAIKIQSLYRRHIPPDNPSRATDEADNHRHTIIVRDVLAMIASQFNEYHDNPPILHAYHDIAEIRTQAAPVTNPHELLELSKQKLNPIVINQILNRAKLSTFLKEQQGSIPPINWKVIRQLPIFRNFQHRIDQLIDIRNRRNYQAVIADLQQSRILLDTAQELEICDQLTIKQQVSSKLATYLLELITKGVRDNNSYLINIFQSQEAQNLVSPQDIERVQTAISKAPSTMVQTQA